MQEIELMSTDDIAIEVESGNENVVIDSPFDPNSIKVKNDPINIGQILDSLSDGLIHLDTEFQRLPNLWDNKKKSRFIESLLMKLPLPAFFFAEKEENDWEIVDGLQRISTLKSFVLDKNMVLGNLEFLKQYHDYSFDQLPGSLQTRIKRTPITAYVIEKGTPDIVKYNIFSRINQGGLILKPQEIRHAINQGVASDLVADLVRCREERDEKNQFKKRKNYDGIFEDLMATPEGKAFATATDWRIKPERMEDRDFATRFLAFYLIPYTQYEPDLDSFLNNGMAAVKKLDKAKIKKLKDDFKKAMDLAFGIFENDAFRKRFSVSDDRKPINKALFEVLSVSFSKLSDDDAKLLLKRKGTFRKKLIQLHNDPSGKFLRAITQGTAQKDLVNQRFKDIKKIIKDTLEGL
ncbi:MAG: DUF262 domain-containing protein [Phycisphaerae bacterium]|nr:DUF262 domain-containing protein [Saprospiraceae bacterium]